MCEIHAKEYANDLLITCEQVNRTFAREESVLEASNSKLSYLPVAITYLLEIADACIASGHSNQNLLPVANSIDTTWLSRWSNMDTRTLRAIFVGLLIGYARTTS